MIKSSFKKKDTSNTKDSNYFHFGNRDLDGIFNNQFMRGTLVLLEEDYPTKHYLSLLRYFVGCGVHKAQKTYIYDLLEYRWSKIIPQIYVPSKSGADKEGKEGDGTKTAEKSQIAWRYDEMNIQLKEQNENKDIPILDLSKHFDINSAEFKAKNLLVFVSPKEVTSYKELFDNIFNQVQESLSDSNDRTLKRIIFPNFFATFCQLKVDLFEINKFFHSLRVFARSTYCTFIFSMRLDDEVLRNNLRFIFDYVLSLEVLKNSEDFEDFQGFLRLSKIPSLNKFLSHPHESEIFGFKASKKRFEIEKLYLNPEKESTEFTGTRHEGPLMCSSKPGGVKKELEF